MNEDAPTNPAAAPTPKCAKCGADMEEGHIPEQPQGQRQIAMWSAGKPNLTVYSSARIISTQARPICAFRCTKCGYLESYAP